MKAIVLPSILTASMVWCGTSEALEAKSVAGVIAAEDGWVRALEARDLRALRERLAPEFLHTNWRGQLLDRAATLSAAAAARPAKNALSGLRVNTFGRVAVAHGVNAFRGGGYGTVRLRFTDVFVYRNGAWRAVSAQETLEQ